MNPYTQGDTFDPSTIRWVENLSEIRDLRTAIFGATEVVVDLETTGLDEHATGRDRSWPVAARISCASFTLPQKGEEYEPGVTDPPTFVVALSHPETPMRGRWREVLTSLALVLRQAGAPITNQNLKFDLRWIFAASTGVDLTHLFAWDTQIGSHLLDENASTRLKECAPRAFGVRRWDDHDLSTPGASERVPWYDLGVYAARDTYWTWRLAVWQRTRMSVGDEASDDPPEDAEEREDRRLGSLAVWCAMPTSATLTAIEQRGWRLDTEWVRAATDEYLAIAQKHYEHLAGAYDVEHTGDPSFAPTSLWFAAWADAAVQAGDLRVAALTPGGKPQWSKAVLIRQERDGSETAGHLLAYRRATKRLEFLTSWLSCVTPDGLVHATYNAGRVVTGRLSASDPNMQQITAALKPAWVPRSGYVIADLDYSQIELRVAAHIAECEPMRQAFRDGADLHRLLAAEIVRREEVTADERQQGKAGNFGFLFGMGAAGFREYALTNYGVAFTEEEAVDVRQAFFDRWDGMAGWHERAMTQARRTQQVVSPIGRVRRLPMIVSGSDYHVSHAERQAINSPVQGFASDLMQIAAASIAGNLPGYDPVPGVHIVGTVHDSIVVEVPEDDWQRATGRCMRRMLDLAPVLRRMGCTLTVPLGVEAKVGTRWGLADVGKIA